MRRRRQVYKSASEVPILGWSVRQANAAAMRAREAARRADPALHAIDACRRAIRLEDDLKAALKAAKEHLDRVTAKLRDARSDLEHAVEIEFRRSEPGRRAPELRDAIARYPELIERAAAEVAAATAALEDHQTYMIEIGAKAAPSHPVEPPAENDAEEAPVGQKPEQPVRGRGRPPKGESRQ